MPKEKNKYGQYFTIESIAEFMVSLLRKGTSAPVLEPSCGQGVFIDMLRKHGFGHITAYEIDPTLAHGFDCVKHESFVSSPIAEKFDAVVGNPPYIRWKNLEPELKSELENSALWSKHFNSLCDYLFIFVLKSIEQLNPEGELVFICPEYWMNTTHSKALRDYMAANGCFSDIYQFKEASLFEGVTSSFVIFRYVKTHRRTPSITLHKYGKKSKPTFEELQNGSCFERSEIPQFQMNDRWLLAEAEERDRINLFEKACAKRHALFADSAEMFRIGDFCDIGNGMVSGCDKAFQVSGAATLNDEEKRYLISVFKAKDLDRYRNVSGSLYFFVGEPFDEESFKAKCPNLYRQAVANKEQLEKRYRYGKELKIWEFAFPRNEKLFRRREKRIFVPCKERISTRHYFRFALADETTFPLQDVTGIFRKKCCKESIEYLLAYLNNPRIFDWLRHNGIVKGNIVEFSEAPIASIPYRPIRWDDSREVALHNQIVESTRDYIRTGKPSHIAKIEDTFNRLFA